MMIYLYILHLEQILKNWLQLQTVLKKLGSEKTYVISNTSYKSFVSLKAILIYDVQVDYHPKYLCYLIKCIKHSIFFEVKTYQQLK